jgi:hypothetical protein
MKSASWTAERRPSRERAWARRLVTLLAAIVTLVTFLIVVGVHFPTIPWVGAIGTLVESFSSLHVVIAAVLGLLLALWARRLGGRGGVSLLVALAAIATVGAIVPVVALARAAHRYGAPISWADHLRVAVPGPPAVPDQTQLYATVDGKDLYLDIYLPATLANSASLSGAPLSAPVVAQLGSLAHGARLHGF